MFYVPLLHEGRGDGISFGVDTLQAVKNYFKYMLSLLEKISTNCSVKSKHLHAFRQLTFVEFDKKNTYQTIEIEPKRSTI